MWICCHRGIFEGIDADALGLNSVEMDATDTLEYLQQQVEAADSLDSIEAIEPLELVPSDLAGGDPLGVEISDGSGKRTRGRSSTS